MWANREREREGERGRKRERERERERESVCNSACVKLNGKRKRLKSESGYYHGIPQIENSDSAFTSPSPPIRYAIL